MRYYLLLALLFGCGGEYKVSGQVDVVYKIDLSNITAYFTADCLEKYPYDIDAQTVCINDEVTKFIKFLEGSQK